MKDNNSIICLTFSEYCIKTSKIPIKDKDSLILRRVIEKELVEVIKAYDDCSNYVDGYKVEYKKTDRYHIWALSCGLKAKTIFTIEEAKERISKL